MHKLGFKPLCLLCLVMPLGMSMAISQDIRLLNLKVEHLGNADFQVANGYPIAGHGGHVAKQVTIGNKQPVFGWELAGEKLGAAQTAFRIVISNHPDSLIKGADIVWDSEKMLSDESTNILFAGKPLKPNSTYVWRAMVWDQDGNPSPWSSISRFRTADSLENYHTAYYPLQKTDEHPQRMLNVNNELRIDFGKASFGQLKLTLESAVNGDTATVRFGETVNEDGSINRKPGGTIRYVEYRLPLNRGRHTYQVQFRPDRRNTGRQAVLMPEYIGEVLPFRYVELEGYSGSLAAADVVRSTVHYPFDDAASHFTSSDPVLNAVWELCKYSIKATSFAGIYVDGDRERIPYEADAYINQLCHYSVDKEYSMARRSHEYLLERATWPTEWILQSVLMAYNDYLYTGDIRSVRHHYDDLKAKLLLPLRGKNGLISTKTGKQTRQLMASIHYQGDSIRDIVDWPHTGGFGMVGNGETDGFVFTDYNAVVNAFHYKALCDMVIMAEAVGRNDEAIFFRDRAEETYKAFQSLLWDKSRKVFRDGIDTDHASLHTNMMAMTFGLVAEKQRANVMDFIRSRGMACSVYGSQFLMDATYAAGDAEYGLSLLNSQDDRSWYNMHRQGSTITMEAWDNKYKPNQDWNHAWGAVPANAIPRKLMGVEPLKPGWGTFRIRPQIGSLERAEIRVPTIKGAISVSCEQDVSNYRLTFDFPANTKANIELPIRQNSKPLVTLNGEVIKAVVKSGWLRLEGVASGSYELLVSYP